MEGFSIISYKDQPIFYFDYSVIGESKEKIFQVLKCGLEEMQNYPPKSVLVLANFTNFRFDQEIIEAFKEERFQTSKYTKKVAVVRVKGVLKLAYDFITNISKSENMDVFESEQEAKDWLVSE